MKDLPRLAVFASLLVLVLLATPAAAEWRRAESTNFIVYAEYSENDLRDYVLELERFDRLLRYFSRMQSSPPPTKLRIFVLRRAEDVDERLIDEWTLAGVYISDPRGPFLMVPRRSLGSGQYRVTGQNVLFHEYSHHFMLHYFPTNYPAWYVEGFAEFYSTTRFKNHDEIEIGFPLRAHLPWLRWMPWIRHRDLLSNRLANTDMTYAQGWLLVHKSAFDPETRTALANYLQAISHDTPPNEAFDANFGDWDPSLDDRMRDYAARRSYPILRFNLALPVPESIEIRRLSEEEADIDLLYARQDGRLHDEVLEAVRDYPDNPQAHVEMAISQIAREDYRAAIESADRALALDPDHVEANVYRGLATLESIGHDGFDPQTAERDQPADMTPRQVLEALGDLAVMQLTEAEKADPRWAEARTYFLRANRIDPYSAPPLMYYFLTFPDRETRPENAMAALDQAFNFVPQSAAIRLFLGREYLERRDFAQARLMLAPLAGDPHASTGGMVAALYWELAHREMGLDQADLVIDELATQIEEAIAARVTAASQLAAAGATGDGDDSEAAEIDEADEAE